MIALDDSSSAGARATPRPEGRRNVLRIRLMGILVALSAVSLLVACAASTPQSEPSAQAGAGTADPEPEDRLREAVRNTLEAESFRLLSDATIAAANGRQLTDVVFVRGDAQGTQHSTAPGYDSVVDFIRVGDSVYVKTGELYYHWIFPLELLQFVVDRWVVFPADDPDHAGLFIIDGPEQPWQSDGDVNAAGTDTVDGTPVLVYETADGNRLSITAEGVPYLLRVEAAQVTEEGEVQVVLTFSEIGTVSATIAVPPGPIFDPLTDFPEEFRSHD